MGGIISSGMLRFMALGGLFVSPVPRIVAEEVVGGDDARSFGEDPLGKLVGEREFNSELFLDADCSLPSRVLSVIGVSVVRTGTCCGGVA